MQSWHQPIADSVCWKPRLETKFFIDRFSLKQTRRCISPERRRGVARLQWSQKKGNFGVYARTDHVSTTHIKHDGGPHSASVAWKATGSGTGLDGKARCFSTCGTEGAIRNKCLVKLLLHFVSRLLFKNRRQFLNASEEGEEWKVLHIHHRCSVHSIVLWRCVCLFSNTFFWFAILEILKDCRITNTWRV